MQLPILILDGIKEIFIPDMEEMKVEFSNFINKVSVNATGGMNPVDLAGANSAGSREPMDISGSFNVAGLNLGTVKFLDLRFFKDGIVYFRPVINGFLGWLLAMFYYREFLSFIGQAPMMGHAVSAAEAHQEKQAKASKQKG